MNKHSVLSTTHPEWARMWECLCDLTGHYTDCNPASGESWQYTGTFWKDRPATHSPLLVHEFGHQDRPLAAKPILGLTRSYGAVRLHILASHEYSGNRNIPLEEGSLVYGEVTCQDSLVLTACHGGERAYMDIAEAGSQLHELPSAPRQPSAVLMSATNLASER